jgi:rubrerythrin
MSRQLHSGGHQPEDEYVRFWTAGENATGEYHCSECSYGATVHSTLPACPVCAGTSWEQSAWSPFSRALRQQ